MAERTEHKTIEKQAKVTYYECDKCHGEYHEETKFEDDLNKVVFGAEKDHKMTRSGHRAGQTTVITGDYEHLFCDHCYAKAHDYFRDFI